MAGKKEEEIQSARIRRVREHLDLAEKSPNDKESIYLLREIAYLYRNDPEPKLKELATRADKSLPKQPPVDGHSDTARQGYKP